METVEYGGWKHNLRLSNGEVELLITLDVGPRILAYRLKGGPNVFFEDKGQLGKSGEPDWQARGGHRLWTAPEDLTRTYAADNGPVKHEAVPTLPGTVRLTPEPEKAYGIQKQIDVTLAPKGSQVTVLHRLINIGTQPADLAPWALTILAAGGTEVIPLPPKKPHPGSPKSAHSPADFGPAFPLVAWPYTDLKDPRFTLGSKYILVRQDKGRPATKIGLGHRQGWVAYLNQGALFVKRFPYKDGQPYPDFGCNFETFTNPGILEMETLGPLVKLPPGGVVEHAEIWELLPATGVPTTLDESAVDQHILPLVTKK